MKRINRSYDMNWRRSARAIGATVLLSVAIGVNAQTSTGGAPSAAASDAGAPQAGMATNDMRQSMMGSMQQMQSVPMTGDTDRDFATMMRPHHQGAVDMAEAELKSGHDPKMRDMAKKIIAAQNKEIKEFDDWLAKHKASDRPVQN